MNNLDTLLRSSKRPLFMAHCIAGYPSIEDSLEVARALVKGGADIIELQIPFSDPLADGPTIMAASEEAIRAGAQVSDAFVIAKTLSTSGTPVVVMSYANPIFRYGIREFVESAEKAGVAGLIVPDVPFDTKEGEILFAETKKRDIHLILVVSPGVSHKRLMSLAPYTSGFVYCTSRQGITGADSKFATDLEKYLKDMREIFGLPIGLGFGVKTREDFQNAATMADIVIAGSVFVEAVKQGGAEEVLRSAQSLVA